MRTTVPRQVVQEALLFLGELGPLGTQPNLAEVRRLWDRSGRVTPFDTLRSAEWMFLIESLRLNVPRASTTVIRDKVRAKVKANNRRRFGP